MMFSPRQSAASTLKAASSELENSRYVVRLDRYGDIASIVDKTAGKEMLAGPIRLVITTDNPQNWPAWNMDFDQVTAAPRTVVAGPAQVRVVENGPARVAVEVAGKRKARNSHRRSGFRPATPATAWRLAR